MTLLPFIISCLICQETVAQADTTCLSEVVVTGTRVKSDARLIAATVNVVDSARLAQSGNTNFLPTLAEVVPGLFVTSRGVMGYGVSSGSAGGISVRGMRSTNGQLMVMVDGHPQYSGIYGHTLSDAYQTLLAGRVEVMRGPASVLYGGNAMGGVVNIITHDGAQRGTTDAFRAKGTFGLSGGSYGTLQADLGGRFSKGPWNGMLIAQYQRSDNHRPNMKFSQGTVFGKMGYTINRNWRVWCRLDMTHWNAQNPGMESAPVLDNVQHITRGAAMVSIDNRYDNHSGCINAYSNWGRHTIDDGYHRDGGTPQTELFQSRDALTGLSAWETFSVCNGNTTTVGIDYQRIYGHAWYTCVVTDTVVTAGGRDMQSARKGMNQIAAYIDTRQHLGRHWTASAGLRYDYHSVSGGEWVPQVGLAWLTSRGGALKGSFGKGFRTPSLKDLYLYGTRNDALRPERLLNYELAWRKAYAASGLSYGINIYYMRADNIIMVLEGHNANTGKVRNCGVEAEMAWRIGSHWRMDTNHSYIRMKRRLAFTPVYKGNIGANGTYGRFTLMAHVQQLCGLYVSTSGAYASNDAEGKSATLIDAGVSCSLPGHVTVWLRGENLLAQRYEFVKGYPMPRATFMAGVRVRF